MASTQKPKRGKKHFTPAEATASLPLVQAIVKDITELACSLRDRQERLSRAWPGDGPAMDRAHQEELEQVQAEFVRDRERLEEYEQELKDLGVELKDYFMGLIDFPCWVGDREVYLCWRLGEPEIAYWHEVDAGFAGRQDLAKLNAARGPGSSRAMSSN